MGIIDSSTKQKILSFFKIIDKYYFLPILFILFILIYLITHENLFGLMMGLTFILMVIEDIIKGLLTGGVRSELKELIVALLVAIGVWYGISFLLNTSTPISAVVTCSMLPTLERGDMVIVRGENINTYGTIYVDSVDDIGSEAIVKVGNITKKVNGSIDSYCVFHSNDPLCAVYRSQPDRVIEYHGKLEFHYGVCKRKTRNNTEFYVPCVVSVKKIGSPITISLYPHSDKGDIIVYQPNKGDLFSYVGDIVHRGVVKIVAKDGTYFLTKGDNNQITDLQVYYPGYGGNHLIPEKNVKGKVIFRIPVIGYVKLFISAQLNMPEQCNYIFDEEKTT